MKIYIYPPCSTCKKALKKLEDLGFAPERINIKENPPSAEELRTLIKQSGLELKHFFNSSGQIYRELNLKERRSTMSDDEQIKLLSENGMLIKRPLLVTENTALVGYRSEAYEDLKA